jgi:transcriptional regulator with XRE-family HTH domain
MLDDRELSNLGKSIKHNLEQKSWTQKKLAELSGVSESTISKLINDTPEKPEYETLLNLASAFGIHVNELIKIHYPKHLITSSDSVVEKPLVNLSFLIENIFGRSNELATLIEYTDRSRLIFIESFVGSGKTTVAKALLASVDDKFKEVFFNPKMPIAEIIDMLNKDRYLFVLDKPDLDNEEYIPLLQEIAETKHQSCVIVTCRDCPRGYRDWAYRPKVVTLTGLDEPDAIALLQNEGLSPQADKTLVQTLIKKYEGIPWGLKLAVQDILELHNGNLAEYLGKSSTVFSRDFSKEIDEIIARLSPLELEVLYWLALQNAAIPYPEIREAFTDRRTTLIDGNEVGAAVKELNRRLLIETNETGIALRTTVQQCAKSQLRKILSKEIKAIAANDMSKLHWLYSLDLVDEQIKLCDRFSRHEPTIIQALTQVEATSKEKGVNVIGYAIANLRYLLGKPIE